MLDYLSSIIYKYDIKIINLTDSFYPVIKALPKKNIDETPEVSVIIPCFNASKFLDEAIRSVTAQSFKNIELLIIDDGSTDNTLHIAKIWAERDERIKIYEKINGGVSSARNCGLAKAKGKYIAFLDADDRLAEKSIEIRLSEKKIHEGFVGVYGKTSMISEGGKVIRTYGAETVLGFENLYTFPMHISSILVPAIWAKQLNFNENMTNGEDWKYFAELARRGLKYHPCNEVTSFYRLHDNSAVGKNYILHLKKLDMVYNWLQRDYWGYGFYPVKYQVGIDVDIIKKEKNNRFLAALIASVFTDKEKEAKEIKLYIDLKFKNPGKILSNQIELIAKETFSRLTYTEMSSPQFFRCLIESESKINEFINRIDLSNIPNFVSAITNLFDEARRSLSIIPQNSTPPFTYDNPSVKPGNLFCIIKFMYRLFLKVPYLNKQILKLRTQIFMEL
jgi:glycosyltransferase involved in cell wall biosynthesis